MRSVIAAALVLLLPACGGNEDVPESEGVFATVTLHLCLAYNGDTARDLIGHFEIAHDGLHELADRTAAVDRAAAASLLEAKQRFEAAAKEPARLDDLRAALDALVLAADDALVALGDPRLECLT